MRRREYTVDPACGVVYGKRGLPIMGRGRAGYVRVRTGPTTHVAAHRLIWESVNGPIPDGMFIDHINGDILDNRIENLRICTNAANQMNRHAVQGTVPLKGVCIHKQTGKFQAQIKVDGKSIYLGLFSDPDDAAAAYRDASMKYFGEFATANNEDHK